MQAGIQAGIQAGLNVGVQITTREIYDALIALSTRVDILIQQGNHNNERAQDHETRLRTLERAKWPLPSVAVLMSIIGFCISFFVHH